MNEDELFHYGTPRHSGRYPWGSGKNPYQRSSSFLNHIKDLEKEGLSKTEIAKGMDMTTSEMRAKISIANEEVVNYERYMCSKLRDKGMSNVAIGKRLGLGESTVRNRLKPIEEQRKSSVMTTANVIKEAVDKHGFVDVGRGVDAQMGISETRKNAAIQVLKEQGYKVQYLPVKQLGTGNTTTIKALSKPDMTWKECNQRKEEIGHIVDFSKDMGATYDKFKPPVSVDPKRVQVVYKEQGGAEKDGVIELRRGVADISLGDARYAQVRIAVDGTHYLKGMAIYADDLPKGVDIRFNTNKHEGTPMLGDKDNTVLKPMKTTKDGKVDLENPFGAAIKDDNELLLAQRTYKDSKGKEHQSALNIVNEEGNWSNWKKSIASQVLSKQSSQVAKRQLDLDYSMRNEEFDEYKSLTNPTVKQKLLESFADNCDSAAVHLKAAALPRQGSHVIIPVNSLKTNEIFAPNYRDGEKVVLIRYPHGGKFEIPELVVNNKNKEATGILGKDARDAVGIHHSVAEQLSGADFDGDSVLVIPNNKKIIQHQPAIKELQEFDPKELYKNPEGTEAISNELKQKEMGKVSNLITDMTIGGANVDEIVRAVKHSMVVIDAEKHNLNIQQSYKDNQIAELKKLYQGGANKGASTIISRAKSDYREPMRKELGIDPETGKKKFKYTGETYPERKKNPETGEWEDTGREKLKTKKTTKMAVAEDAYSLTSGGSKENPGNQIEAVYADYANKMKAMADEARKIAVNSKGIERSPSAAKAYEAEVISLTAQLVNAKKNSPLERKAQALANKEFSMKLEDNPDMDDDDKSKEMAKSLNKARIRLGSKKQEVKISDKEWEAIQAGAISPTKLKDILNNTDLDRIKSLATPRTKTVMSSAKIARAKAMLNAGYTRSEVADHLGISTSTLSKALQ